jgi:hypothetical protein
MNGRLLTLEKLTYLVALTILTTLALAACGPQDVTVKLKESDVNKLIQEVVVTGAPDDILVEITGVDMQAGFIRVNGEHEREDGTTVPGSFDVALSTENGVLKAEIIAVNVADIELNDSRITRINADLAKSFARAAAEVEQVTFKSATITEDAVEFILTIDISAPK